ncbi:MAG: metalloregulator ArsR/SmtB family transcription factor [Pseudomonadota bacterium]
MNDEQAAHFLGALANPTRLAIVRHLVRAGPEGAAAGAIAASVDATPSRASFHLAALAELGVVSAERQSRSMIYHINFDRLGSVLRYFIEECCAGNPVLRASCGVRC